MVRFSPIAIPAGGVLTAGKTRTPARPLLSCLAKSSNRTWTSALVLLRSKSSSSSCFHRARGRNAGLFCLLRSLHLCDKGERGGGAFECCVVIKFQFPLIFLCQVCVRVVPYIVFNYFILSFPPYLKYFNLSHSKCLFLLHPPPTSFIHTHTHTRTHARTHARTHTHTHTHARARTRTHAHARTHTHTRHTYTLP